MALSPVISVSIKHKQAGSDRLPWYTTYFLRAVGLVEDIPYVSAQTMIEAITTAEAALYYDTVQLLGGTATTFIAATTVPNPNPPPYDPAQHTAWSTLLDGERTLSGEQLYYDQVVDIVRNVEFGNPGHIEVRGALVETEVQTTLGQKNLTPTAATAWSARIALFEAAIKAAANSEDVEFIMVGQPLTSNIPYIDANNKVRYTKTYGAAYFRVVSDFTLGPVRTDKGFNKYFDRGV